MATKKSNGEGSIYKRADGRWCASVTVGYNPNGSIKRKYLYGKTKKEVHQKMVDLQNDININDGYIQDDLITLNQWGRTYLFEFLKPTLRPSSFERYESVLRNHIKESKIGDMKLKDIKSFHIQTLLNSKTHMSKSSIKKIYQLLSMLFDKAVLNDLIRKSPMPGVNMPKSEKPVKEIKILSRQEQKQFMLALDKEKQKALFLVTLFAGLRQGELVALKWGNVDLDEGEITVCESYKITKIFNTDGSYANELIKQAPKTESGKRAIPIPSFLVEELKKYRTKQLEYGVKKAGGNFNPTNLVFCSEVGTPLLPSNIYRIHTRLCEDAKINHIPFHALRHTFATRLIEEGEDIKTVQKLLGHSTIEIAYKIYVHVTKETKKAAAKVQDNLYKELLK